MEKKSRIVYLLKYLMENSDEDKPVSTAEIIEYMDAQGIVIHRTTITADIALLTQAGFDVVTVRSAQNKYFIGNRTFELPEVKILIDAVLSSKIITAKKTRELIKKLSTLASESQSKLLQKHTKVVGRVKSGNEKVYYAVNEINSAILSGHKVSFTYFEYNQNKKKVLKNDKKPYVLSPYGMAWSNDKYYVIGYSEKHGHIAQFRVDRIAKITTTELSRVPPPPKFTLADYVGKSFDMFGGDSRTVELLCENRHMKSIIDRFGEKVQTHIHDEDCFIATVDVSVGPAFFAWVFKFCGEIKIYAPESVKDEYRKILSLSQI